MKNMKDKVKKEKVQWFMILEKMDEGKFLPEFNKYLRRIQIKHSKFSFNRIAYNFFKMKFGSTTTAIVRSAVRAGMTYDDLLTYYKNSRWLVNHLIVYHVPRYLRKKEKKDYYELL